MIRRNARSLYPIQDRCGTMLIDDVIPRVLEVSTILFPEEVDAEAVHERRELVRDVLQDLGVGLEGAHERRVRLEQLLGDGEGG